MREDLKLPPRWKVKASFSCAGCVNENWCSKFCVVNVAYKKGCPISVRNSYICDLYKDRHGYHRIIIGICLSDSMGTIQNLFCSKDNYCPYCKYEAEAECKIHRHTIYNTNSYFKNNGVCCECLEEFKFEENMKESEKVYMVRK